MKTLTKKVIRYNADKNKKLKKDRSIDFEDVINVLKVNGAINTFSHPNQNKYPGQKIFIVEFNSYIYAVPYIENEQEIFLKTIFPSRKELKRHIQDN